MKEETGKVPEMPAMVGIKNVSGKIRQKDICLPLNQEAKWRGRVQAGWWENWQTLKYFLPRDSYFIFEGRGDVIR